MTVVSGGQLSNRLRAEILELFEEANQAEERELSAVYQIQKKKHSLKPDGKFGAVKPVFFKPTVNGHQLRSVHSDLRKIHRRRHGWDKCERKRLREYRARFSA